MLAVYRVGILLRVITQRELAMVNRLVRYKRGAQWRLLLQPLD